MDVEGEISAYVKAWVIGPFEAAAQKGDRQTDGLTNGPTNRPTDGPTKRSVESRSTRLE